MKSVLFTLCLLATSFFALAQDDDGMKITYGLAGGANVSWFSVKAPSRFADYIDLAEPVSVGVNADFQFNDYFSIRPSIIYQGKGAIVMAPITTTYTLHYLEVPVDIMGHLPISEDGANFFLGVGPFLSFALNGNSKLDGYDTRNNVSFGSNGDFKSMEFGATTVFGVQFNKGTAVSINVDFGLTNILQKSDLDIGATSAKTATFYVGLAQSF